MRRGAQNCDWLSTLHWKQVSFEPSRKLWVMQKGRMGLESICDDVLRATWMASPGVLKFTLLSNILILQWREKRPQKMKKIQTTSYEGESESLSVLSGSLRSHELYHPWNSSGQNTGVGILSLLQGVIPTQELNWGLLHCRHILYQLSYQGSLKSYNPFIYS